VLSRLGRFTVRHRKLVLAGTALFLIAAGVLGSRASDRLIPGGFEDPDSESARAARTLEREFDTSDPNLVLLVTADRSVDDPAIAAAGQALTDELAAEPHVQQVVSYWSLGNVAPLRSGDGTQALIIGTIAGDDNMVHDRVEDLSPRYERRTDGMRVDVGGYAEVFRFVNHQVEQDLVRAELIAFPVTLVLLVLVFGSVVAAGLPLAVGGLAIVGTLLLLLLVSMATDVSIFALNAATGMGLGLGIDYSLFVVSRYREELRRGLDPHAAVVRTVETAGRTIAFSALTLAISIAALLIFPLAFLRSFAYAGIGISLFAGLVTVVSLPALLAVIGRRVDSLRLWRRKARPDRPGIWHRVATVVMRRPVPVGTVVIVMLLALGAPFLHIEFGIPDDRVLPPGSEGRYVQDEIRANFTGNEAGALQVVAGDAGDPAAQTEDIDDYARALSRLPGASRVDAFTGVYVEGERVLEPGLVTDRFEGDGGTWLSVVPEGEPLSPEGERLARRVRGVTAPFDVDVAGQGAELADGKDALFARLPLALGWIALATFVLLFLMFGSVVVPIKAIVINVLSLSATFGAMVWIFQDGHLAEFLDFTPTGTLAASIPILVFCIAFGLSMDYELFLLSRIKEEHDRTGDNTASVALGLERTGRIVTAAAVLISVVFLAFATSGVTFIKLFGIGLAIAVLMDAFVIRATLVPAFMRLAGEANWWAPRPLRRLHDRFGLAEHVPSKALAATDRSDEPVLEDVGAR
jgi:RND superfamily putative drug exporter